MGWEFMDHEKPALEDQDEEKPALEDDLGEDAGFGR